jgi:hypothetical protein
MPLVWRRPSMLGVRSHGTWMTRGRSEKRVGSDPLCIRITLPQHWCAKPWRHVARRSRCRRTRPTIQPVVFTCRGFRTAYGHEQVYEFLFRVLGRFPRR